ncbi:MAG TPA: ribbon-helix-helix protein, CopG family [Candidatus Dormibacteraeota bacterium]
MRRLQVHLDDELDDALAAEAAHLGTSKAAIIRRALTRDLPELPAAADDPWEALDGWLSAGGVDDIDAAIYEHQR